MNKRLTFLLLLLSYLPFVNAAEEALQIKMPWVREAPPTAKNLAGYVELTNPTSKPILIQSATSPLFQRVEMHITSFENGMMRMKEIEQLTIQPGETIYFEPGGKHFMLIKPKKPIKAGLVIPVTITIKNQDSMLINFQVRK